MFVLTRGEKISGFLARDQFQVNGISCKSLAYTGIKKIGTFSEKILR
jgi:hypothetical protein